METGETFKFSRLKILAVLAAAHSRMGLKQINAAFNTLKIGIL
jgi:hypothetical protein